VFLFIELPDRLLERKINLCTELLEVADILDPGATRIRGLLLYDLQAAMVVQAKRDLASDKIMKAAARVSIDAWDGWVRTLRIQSNFGSHIIFL
jgi:hypothetical protein